MSFSERDLLSSKPTETVPKYLREIGDDEAADRMATRGGGGQSMSRFWEGGDGWGYTGLLIGFIPPDAEGTSIRIEDAMALAPNNSLKDTRVKITLDRFWVQSYPGSGKHTILCEFTGKNQIRGGRSHSVVKTRGLYQCTKCRRQTSPIAGTIFASTKLPLRTWFRAMYHLTQSKQGMMERDGRKRLKGRVEIDDAVLGGERSGGKRGRSWRMLRRSEGSLEDQRRGGAPGKPLFVAAVETTDDGKPVRLKLRRVAGFTGQAISRFALHSLDPSCTVVSDGIACFHRVADAGCQHQAILTGSGPAAVRHPVFKWVNTALGNIKSAIIGTYRAISSKHVPRYLAEFKYRFNRRYDLASMIPSSVTP